MDEPTFRALLDPSGIVRPGVTVPCTPHYLVFAQRADAFIDVAGWQRHAERYFGCRVGLTTEKRYEAVPLPREDAARVVVVSTAGASSTHLLVARARTGADLALAQAAESRANMPGLAGLAGRCLTVWQVELGGSAEGTLRLAGVLASCLLGPILTPGGEDVFGVKTARERLERGVYERGVPPRAPPVVPPEGRD